MSSKMICNKNQKLNKDQLDLVQKFQKIREEMLKQDIVLPNNSHRLRSKEMTKKIQSIWLDSKVGQEFLKSEISSEHLDQKQGKTSVKNKTTNTNTTTTSLEELEKKTNDLMDLTRKNSDPATFYRKFKKNLIEKDYLTKKRVWREKQAAFYQEIDDFGGRQIESKDLTINYSGGGRSGTSLNPGKIPEYEPSGQNDKGASTNSNDNLRLIFQDTNANAKKGVRSSSKEENDVQPIVQLLEPPKRGFGFVGKPLSFNNFNLLHDDGTGDREGHTVYENDERFVKLLDTLTPICKSTTSCESTVNSPPETEDEIPDADADGEYDFDLNFEMEQIFAELELGEFDEGDSISIDSVSPRFSEVSEISSNDVTFDYETDEMRTRFVNLHKCTNTTTTTTII